MAAKTLVLLCHFFVISPRLTHENRLTQMGSKGSALWRGMGRSPKKTRLSEDRASFFEFFEFDAAGFNARAFGFDDFGFRACDEVGVIEFAFAGFEVFFDFGDVFVQACAFFVDVNEVGEGNDEFDAVGDADGARCGFGCVAVADDDVFDFGELADRGGHGIDDLSSAGVVAEGEDLWDSFSGGDIGFTTNIADGGDDADECLG